MKPGNLLLFVAFSFSILFTQNEALAQVVRMNFESVPSEGIFRYRADTDPDFTISPGGTVTTPGELVEFSSFADFQADVVGVWTLVEKGTVATFEIESFNENAFPPFELVSPTDGDEFETGSFVPIDTAGPTNFLFGAGGGPDVTVFLVPGGFIAELAKGVLEAPVRVDAIGIRAMGDFITNVNDSQSSLEISTTSTFFVFDGADFTIFRNSILGDVNRDGVVDLLDIDPFVDLILSGGFQFEADINGDGVVDLLDVGPFVDLLD